MQILRSTEELSTYLRENDCEPGCFADTSFLYGAAYSDDRLFEKAMDVIDQLTEKKIPLYANVISRMEFVDLILRKQITKGCIKLFEKIERGVHNQELFNLLKNIRDNNTAAERNKESFKIGEGQIKKLRKLIVDSTAGTDWKNFCAEYTHSVLVPEWKLLEDELGLNFIEILEGETSELFKEPLRWSDMVQIMGQHGMRGPDAMIMNLFQKSSFPLLITGDSDFENCFEDSKTLSKAVFIL